VGIFSRIGKAVSSVGKFVAGAPKKIAAGAKKLVTDPGDWAKNALKSTVQAAPVIAGLGLGGLPGLAAGGILGKGGQGTSVLGSILDKIPGGGVIKSAVGGKLPGLNDIGALIRDKVMGGKPITIGNVLGGAAGGVGKAVGGIGDVIKSGVNKVKDHPELALAAANAAYGASRAKSADELRKKGVSTAEGSWNTREPLRAAGVRGMLNTERPDLASTFNDPTNPFSRGAAPRGLTPAPAPVRPALPHATPVRPAMPNVNVAGIGLMKSRPDLMARGAAAGALPRPMAPPVAPPTMTGGDPIVMAKLLEEGLKRKRAIRGGGSPKALMTGAARL
jgi:hypothetical protein